MVTLINIGVKRNQ